MRESRTPLVPVTYTMPISSVLVEVLKRERLVIVVVATCVAIFASTFVINRHIGRDWMPQDDQNELMVYAELPEGSSIEATEKLLPGASWLMLCGSLPPGIAKRYFPSDLMGQLPPRPGQTT